jgi:hypothetical protein
MQGNDFFSVRIAHLVNLFASGDEQLILHNMLMLIRLYTAGIIAFEERVDKLALQHKSSAY